MNQEILTAIKKITQSKDRVVLGIDGLGGAGKSTISDELCSELERIGIHTILLHIDDFIHVKSIRYNAAYPEWQCYYDLQWRYDYFSQIISQLKDNSTCNCEIELYDKEHDGYVTTTCSIEKKTVIIVEGIFLQRDELQRTFDYMIYIDIPEAVRMSRVLKRDTYIGNEQQIVNKYKNRYFPAERYYFNEYHPERTADYVIGEKDAN